MWIIGHIPMKNLLIEKKTTIMLETQSSALASPILKIFRP
jgi:hypothetical protein